MANPFSGDHSLVRSMNTSAVMKLIHSDPGISRVRLSNLTGLNKSTVSRLVDDLISRRLVKETGIENIGAGRPATQLEEDGNCGNIIGIELGVDTISVVLSTFSGEILWRKQTDINPTLTEETIIEYALELIDQAIEFNTVKGVRNLGIGMTVPGLVETDTGVLTFSPNLGWRNVPLKQIVFKHTGISLLIDNDANAMAIAEQLIGNARLTRSFISIVAGIGIGSGLFLNGQLYRGKNGFAGEIGHTTLMDGQNRPCRCNKRGCWENSANLYSLIERVRARLEIGMRSSIPSLRSLNSSPLNLEVILQAAEEDDAVALEALHETGEALGIGVANMINIFNPEKVILGGTLSLAGKFLLPAMVEFSEERVLSDLKEKTQLALSAFGADAGVMGAVALIMESILNEPLRVDKVN